MPGRILLSQLSLSMVAAAFVFSGTILQPARAATGPLPRTADGKPDLQGIWQAHTRAADDLETHQAGPGVPASRGAVEGGAIPYQPWAAAKRKDHQAKGDALDPLAKCYMPGVPRVMSMSSDFPFHIFQTPSQISMLFEWSQVYRLIYTNGSKPPEDISFWMGDSRGRWDGDTLVVTVANHNDRTWFDKAGNFHSDALRVTERYTMLDPDTIRYEATIEDPKVFTRPWTIAFPLVRDKTLDRVLEYQCNAEVEEASGAFPREPRTWYQKPGGTR